MCVSLCHQKEPKLCVLWMQTGSVCVHDQEVWWSLLHTQAWEGWTQACCQDPRGAAGLEGHLPNLSCPGGLGLGQAQGWDTGAGSFPTTILSPPVLEHSSDSHSVVGGAASCVLIKSTPPHARGPRR